MKSLDEESVDLIYLDPPFFTEKTHTLKNRDGSKEFSFDDTWGDSANYARFLKDRIEIMHSLLKDTGSIFVHCDKSGEHIVRAVLDSVFGSNNFQSEIIWSYKRWSNAKKGLLPAHQNIYFYSKSKNFKFNRIFKAYSETTNVDQILQKRTRNEKNKTVYAKDSFGNIQYGEKKKGVPLSDVWEIPYLNPKAKERVGYPTQKPILLLEQIIELVTDAGDLVLDPFCGSGTTCVASKLTNRNYLGIDQSESAVELSRERLKKPIKTESNLLKKGRKSYLNVDSNALNLLQGVEFNPVQRNKGIDAILVEQFEGTPVLVRIQKPNEPLADAISLLKKAMETKGSKKSILIQTEKEGLGLGLIDSIDGIEIIETLSIQIDKKLTT
ncbi:site-specific DNA-methyltransferase [Psychrobacter sp. FDAARGOS_221]|nr:site-specific DNA-methyltransferase [Psychrobacter sp. FDAARGOS_221]